MAADQYRDADMQRDTRTGRNANRAPPSAASAGFLSGGELAHRLEAYRSDSRYRGPRRVPLARLALVAGVSRPSLYAAMRGELSETTHRRLRRAIGYIDEGRLTFRREGRQWHEDWHQPPHALPPPQDKRIREAEWNRWASCRTCGGRKWNAVRDLSGRSWMACENCVPGHQFRYLGLTAV